MGAARSRRGDTKHFTAQALAVIVKLMQREPKMKPALIIAPDAGVAQQWFQMGKMFTRFLKFQVCKKSNVWCFYINEMLFYLQFL